MKSNNKVIVSVSITMSKDFSVELPDSKTDADLKNQISNSVVLPSEAYRIVGMLRPNTQAEEDLKDWIVDDFVVIM